MLRYFPVDVLQESTKDAYRNLKPDSWNYLKKIYSIRRLQERYERKEIG